MDRSHSLTHVVPQEDLLQQQQQPPLHAEQRRHPVLEEGGLTKWAADARAALSAFSGFSKNVTVPADPTMRIDTPDTADDIQFPSLMTEAVRVVDRCIEDDTEPPTLAELRQQRARRVEHLASERLKRKHGGGEGVQPFRHDYTVRGTVRKTTLIKRIKSALPSEYSSIVKNAEEDLSVEEGLHRMPDKSEVIISVDVYTTDQRSFRRNDHYESIDILGSQTLKELRDSFCFTCDELYDGPFYARSACFVIGHWVYTDLPDNPGRREKVVNYEEHIRNWLRVHDDSIEPEARQSLPEIHFAEMQSTTVSQAVERLYRLSPNGHSQCCFYLHYTDQEERIYFTNVTLLDSRVHSLIRQVYPLKTFRRQKLNLTLCALCNAAYANVVVLNDPILSNNPMYCCQKCYQHIRTDRDGRIIPPNLRGPDTTGQVVSTFRYVQ